MNLEIRQSNFSCLPNPIRSHIVSFLGPKNFCQLSQISKDWKSFIKVEWKKPNHNSLENRQIIVKAYMNNCVTEEQVSVGMQLVLNSAFNRNKVLSQKQKLVAIHIIISKCVPMIREAISQNTVDVMTNLEMIEMIKMTRNPISKKAQNILSQCVPMIGEATSQNTVEVMTDLEMIEMSKMLRNPIIKTAQAKVHAITETARRSLASQLQIFINETIFTVQV